MTQSSMSFQRPPPNGNISEPKESIFDLLTQLFQEVEEYERLERDGLASKGDSSEDS